MFLCLDFVRVKMGLSGKVEAEVEIKASAEKFFHVFRKQLQHLPNISSQRIHSAVVHEGDWENVDAVKHWEFTVGKLLVTFHVLLQITQPIKVNSTTFVENFVYRNRKIEKFTTSDKWFIHIRNLYN